MTVTERSDLFVGGKWIPAESTDRIVLTNPHTEEPIGTVPDASPADVDRAVAAARAAFDAGPWPRMAPEERLAAVERLAMLYAGRMQEIAALVTAEMGSPISFSNLLQTGSTWMVMNAFAQVARDFTWEERRPGAVAGDILVRREPVGVVAAIAPWNFPQFLIMSKVAPALLAGCTVVVKPSPETALDALVLAELFEAAGLPEGVVNVVPAGRESSEALVRHPGVDKVAFTGSTAAGRRIAAICGEQLKRCTLELGGKSAAIVLDDADLAQVAGAMRSLTFANTGQMCIAHSRVLVPAAKQAAMVDAVSEVAASMAIGDPSDPGTEIGPLATKAQRDRVWSYVEGATRDGARLAYGGLGAPDGFDRGYYVKPTVFADVDNGMTIAREEVFGPVVAVIPYEDDDHAVAIANDSDYGLAGSVFTNDAERGLDIARRVRTGTFGINNYMLDIASPFGGCKASGVGRELGVEGLLAYVEPKSISGA